MICAVNKSLPGIGYRVKFIDIQPKKLEAKKLNYGENKIYSTKRGYTSQINFRKDRVNIFIPYTWFYIKNKDNDERLLEQKGYIIKKIEFQIFVKQKPYYFQKHFIPKGRVYKSAERVFVKRQKCEMCGKYVCLYIYQNFPKFLTNCQIKLYLCVFVSNFRDNSLF